MKMKNERLFNLSPDIVVLVCVFTRRNPENDLSHSHDVIGNVAKIFNAIFILGKASNLRAFKVFEMLLGQFVFTINQ